MIDALQTSGTSPTISADEITCPIPPHHSPLSQMIYDLNDAAARVRLSWFDECQKIGLLGNRVAREPIREETAPVIPIWHTPAHWRYDEAMAASATFAEEPVTPPEGVHWQPPMPPTLPWNPAKTEECECAECRKLQSRARGTKSFSKKRVRHCSVCDAADGGNYSIYSPTGRGSSKTMLCTVNPKTKLCDRTICIYTRRIAGAFDVRRLEVGYHDYPQYFYKDPIHRSILNWVSAGAHSETDPNLECEERYARDPMHYKEPAGARNPFYDHKNIEGGAAAPQHPRRTTKFSTQGTDVEGLSPTSCSSVVARQTDTFIEWMQDCVQQTRRESAHEILLPVERGGCVRFLQPGDRFYAGLVDADKKEFWPIYNTFGPPPVKTGRETRPDVVDKKEIIEEEENSGEHRWLRTPSHPYSVFIEKAYSSPSARYNKDYRDPTVSEGKEADVWKKVQRLFEQDIETVFDWVPVFDPDKNKIVAVFKEVTRPRLKFYANPDGSFARTFHLVRQSTGAADVIQQRELDALQKWETADALSEKEKITVEWVGEYLRGERSLQSVADEIGLSLGAVRTRMSRFLTASPEDDANVQWKRAISSAFKSGDLSIPPALDALWQRAISNTPNGNKTKPGLYALVKLDGAKPRVYPVVAWEKMTGDPEVDEDLQCAGVNDIIRKIVERQIRNETVTKSQARPRQRGFFSINELFAEIESRVCEFPFRSLTVTSDVSST